MRDQYSTRLLGSLCLFIGLTGCAGHNTISPEVQSQLDHERSAITFADEHLKVVNYKIEELELPNGSVVWTSRMEYHSWPGAPTNKDEEKYQLMDFCKSMGGAVPGYNMNDRGPYGYQMLWTLGSTYEIPERSDNYRLCAIDSDPLFLFKRSWETIGSRLEWALYIVEWPKDASREQITADAEALDISIPD